MHEANTGRVGTGALARPAERSSRDSFCIPICRAALDQDGRGRPPHVIRGAQRGRGSGIAASAYPMTAMAVAFSRSS